MTEAAPVDGTVDEWLAWQLTLHAREMDLGLERVARVGAALGIVKAGYQRIVVAGTNGKGSCAALIERLLATQYRVGTYTSPHLWRYNERFRIEGEPVSDSALCAAFRAVEAARGDTTLTFFEYGTLAALWLFAERAVDIAVLEVGLGGRLDAVNIVDSHVALITNIGLDHVDWLGDDRESIGYEKAGIMRAGVPVFCADRAMPRSIADHAHTVGAPLACIGRDFDIETQAGRWSFESGADRFEIERHAGVLADNLAAALVCVQALTGEWPDARMIDAACRAQARLPGRRERVDDGVSIVYDVGHNAEAVAALVRMLESETIEGRGHVVIGMLADKPVEQVIESLTSIADRFYFAGLDTLSGRGLGATQLRERAGCAGACYETPSQALDAARRAARTGDRIVVCGSFLTVANTREAEA